MNSTLLRALDTAYCEARPVALVRPLDGGTQFLVDRCGVQAFAEPGNRTDPKLPPTLHVQVQDARARDDARAIEIDGRRYLVQTIAPPPCLFVIGAVHIAQKLIPMARLAGYRVLLLDPREAFATEQRFPGVEIICDWPHETMSAQALDVRSAVVTLSHDAKIDEPALKCALQSDAFYIGALGSRKNHAKRLRRLRALGFDAESLARICGPIGLPLGGRSPAEIAVAILAQMTQARYARSGPSRNVDRPAPVEVNA